MGKRKSAAERKTQIIEVTLRLADEVGPERLTTEVIASNVGITQAGVFRHFPTKDQLWDAVARFVGIRLEESWTAETHPDEPATQQLRTLFCTQLSFIQSVPAIPTILFSRELHVHRKNLRKSFSEIVERFQKRLAEIIEHGRANGEFRPELEPQDTALLVISVIQGTTLRWSLKGRAFDLTTEGERLFDQLLGGLLAPENGPTQESYRT